MTTVWIVSIEGEDYARAEVTAFATQASAEAYVDGVQEEILVDARERGYDDVPATLAQADEEDYFSTMHDPVFFGIEEREVQP
jgi:hypothetical protein